MSGPRKVDPAIEMLIEKFKKVTLEFQENTEQWKDANKSFENLKTDLYSGRLEGKYFFGRVAKEKTTLGIPAPQLQDFMLLNYSRDEILLEKTRYTVMGNLKGVSGGCEASVSLLQSRDPNYVKIEMDSDNINRLLMANKKALEMKVSSGNSDSANSNQLNIVHQLKEEKTPVSTLDKAVTNIKDIFETLKSPIIDSLKRDGYTSEQADKLFTQMIQIEWALKNNTQLCSSGHVSSPELLKVTAKVLDNFTTNSALNPKTPITVADSSQGGQRIYFSSSALEKLLEHTTSAEHQIRNNPRPSLK